MTSTAGRAERVRLLFDEVADLDPSARVAWLETREADVTVRGEVLDLVRADERPLALLDASTGDIAHAAGLDTDPAPDVASLIGRRVGPYHIEEVLGYGGMGTVFLARREDVGLHVALKLVRGALGDPGRLARFRQEAAVLARFNHPFIATLVDVGVADDGTPYIAMEHVRGVPITTWCAERNLEVPARLRLFVELCDAVAFAHQHLVVHRDIKPLNILVTPEGVVKLLDFGVAKLMDNDADAVQTTTGTRLLSPDYASPEQVSGAPVSTATDVHALGILLFELLTGAKPFGVHARQADVLAAILRDDPLRPSALMTRRVASADDLDAICFKAMAKAPRDRYASVADLAGDVTRHLEGRPVLARLPTLRYRVAKFVRRNALGVAIAAALLLPLLVGAGVVTWRVLETRAALAQAQQLSAFLLDVLAANDPVETRVADAPMRSYLDLALVNMDALSAQPEAQARLLSLLSQAYVGLGRYAQADSLAERGIEVLSHLGGGHDADVGATLFALGSARFELGDREGASHALRDGLARQRRALGDDSHATTETMLRLAEVLGAQGEYAQAEALAREALALRLTDAGRRDEGVADATMRLGRVLALRGTTDVEAERLLRASLTIRQSLYGPNDYRLDRSLTPLAQFLTAQGRGPEAEQLARQALALRQRVYGENDPRAIAALNTLASTFTVQGRVPEARAVYGQVVRRYERAFGGDNLMLAVAINNVASTFERVGALDSAEAHMTRALAMRVRLQGAGNRGVALLRYDLGVLQRDAGRMPAAEASLREAYARLGSTVGDANPATLRAGSLLGDVLVARGRLDEAERLLRDVIARQTQVLGGEHPDLARSIAFLGACMTARRRWVEADSLETRALLMARTLVPPDQPIRRDVVARVTNYYRARGWPERAERVRREEAGVARPAR